MGAATVSLAYSTMSATISQASNGLAARGWKKCNPELIDRFALEDLLRETINQFRIAALQECSEITPGLP
jgi:hypothetical protein